MGREEVKREKRDGEGKQRELKEKRVMRKGKGREGPTNHTSSFLLIFIILSLSFSKSPLLPITFLL